MSADRPRRGRGRPRKQTGKRIHVLLNGPRLRAVDELWAYALLTNPKATRTQAIEEAIDRSRAQRDKCKGEA